MILTLSEDETARRYRVLQTRSVAWLAARACLLYGFPICFVAAVIFYYSFPDRIIHALVTAFIPAVFALGFFILPTIPALCRNRWMLYPDKLRIRGEHFISVSWNHVVHWAMRDIRDLSGYYLLSVRGRFNGVATIILSEEAMPQAELEALLQTVNKRGFNAKV